MGQTLHGYLEAYSSDRRIDLGFLPTDPSTSDGLGLLQNRDHLFRAESLIPPMLSGLHRVSGTSLGVKSRAI